ncbi:MAG: ethylbenzene dehydrogenase-related protein [Planctomycetota bacterium]|nr:ethylbenzene dehydrogenase-related protein [Planctomycetota bacterium]
MPILQAPYSDQSPILDGSGAERIWTRAPILSLELGTSPPTQDPSSAGVRLALRAIYTDTEIFFLAEWPDNNRNHLHQPWTFRFDQSDYTVGDQSEDRISFLFPINGPFQPNQKPTQPSSWDIWTWGCGSTQTSGFALDQIHRVTPTRPTGSRAQSISLADGSTLWVQRSSDQGRSVHNLSKKPVDYLGETVPRYFASKPTGSGADVQAKGSWEAKEWTIEFRRKLSTKNKDDTLFDPSRGDHQACLQVTNGSASPPNRHSRVFLIRFGQRP